MFSTCLCHLQRGVTLQILSCCFVPEMSPCKSAQHRAWVQRSASPLCAPSPPLRQLCGTQTVFREACPRLVCVVLLFGVGRVTRQSFQQSRWMRQCIGPRPTLPSCPLEVLYCQTLGLGGEPSQDLLPQGASALGQQDLHASGVDVKESGSSTLKIVPHTALQRGCTASFPSVV